MPSEEREQLARLEVELASIRDGLAEQEWWACSKEIRIRVSDLMTRATMLHGLVMLTSPRDVGPDE